MGLKDVHTRNEIVAKLKIKSDQNGIESPFITSSNKREEKIKSDQNGIERMDFLKFLVQRSL